MTLSVIYLNPPRFPTGTNIALSRSQKPPISPPKIDISGKTYITNSKSNNKANCKKPKHIVTTPVKLELSRQSKVNNLQPSTEKKPIEDIKNLINLNPETLRYQEPNRFFKNEENPNINKQR